MVARRILITQQPQYLYQKLTKSLLFESERQHNHDTRYGAFQAAPRLALISASWLYRVVADMKRIPRDLLDMPMGGNRDKAFKTRLRAWVVSDSQ